MKAVSKLALVSAAVIFSTATLAQTDHAELASPSMSHWMETQTGPITKKEYLAESGRQWDMMDKNKRGLTAKEINTMYGGNPTPNMVKQSNSMTNPTGTEMKGENGGGK